MSNDRTQNTPHLVIRSLVPSGAASGVLSTACVCVSERERGFGKGSVSEVLL